MSKAVWLRKDKGTESVNMTSGEYDGYGRLYTPDGMVEIQYEYGTNEPCMYHFACWVALGRPKEVKSSPNARDQGHFVGEYDPAKPESPEEVEALKKHSETMA